MFCNLVVVKQYILYLFFIKYVHLQTDYFGDELRVPCAGVLIVMLLAEHYG